METLHAADPASLPPGTQIGAWRVVSRRGCGSYGVVYRVERVGNEETGPFALKLALHPLDPRFEREARLLSRIRHPHVPRLHDQGWGLFPGGVPFPYLVMDWVEGTPLYVWAQQQEPSPEQLLRIVAQLARALAATHGANAVHRDVKGDNIRVRHSDGRVFLIDFGSGHFQGAPRLTWNSLPPGTADYRSPEACLFYLRSVGAPDAYFEATPADDLFALGVTAFRLVTGQYPPALEPLKDEAGAWRLVREEVRPLLEHHPRLDPLLCEWIIRLLSLRAEERGTAEELAEALEGAAARARAPAPVARTPPMREVPASEVALPKQAVRSAPVRRWRPWRALATLGLCWLFVWALQAVHRWPEGGFEDEQDASSSASVPDVGTAAVGDSLPPAPLASAHPPSEREPLTQDLPPMPHPRQARPDKTGKCPGRKQVALNGACWVEQPPMTAEECKENGLVYYKGRCYAPTLMPPEKPLPTSSPADSR